MNTHIHKTPFSLFDNGESFKIVKTCVTKPLKSNYRILTKGGQEYAINVNNGLAYLIVRELKK